MGIAATDARRAAAATGPDWAGAADAFAAEGTDGAEAQELRTAGAPVLRLMAPGPGGSDPAVLLLP